MVSIKAIFLCATLFSVTLSQSFLRNITPTEQIKNLTEGFVATFNPSLSAANISQCILENGNDFINLIRVYFLMEAWIYSNEVDYSHAIQYRNLQSVVSQISSSIYEGLNCAYNTTTFQTILKNNFTNINASTTLSEFYKVLGTQSNSQNRYNAVLAVQNFEEVMDTTNQNWTYTGEQIAKFLLGIDMSYDQDKKNETKSFFRGLTAFFFTQIDDIDKCIDENDVTQVVKFYVELYTAIKGTTFDDIGEAVLLYLTRKGKQYYQQNIDFWTCANNTQTSKQFIKTRLFDFNFESQLTTNILTSILRYQERASTFRAYITEVSVSYNKGDMFYAGYILPWAIEAPSQMNNNRFLDIFY